MLLILSLFLAVLGVFECFFVCAITYFIRANRGKIFSFLKKTCPVNSICDVTFESDKCHHSKRKDTIIIICEFFKMRKKKGHESCNLYCICP